MDYERLEHNLVDMVAEQQWKLGYRRESVSMYYPADSLNHLMGNEISETDPLEYTVELRKHLRRFAEDVWPRLGRLRISNEGERFCIVIPPEGSEYVHGLLETGKMEGAAFLEEFIGTMGRHDLDIKDIVAVFRKYSDDVRIARLENEQFDYLIYFEKGLPDAYRYCIHFEGHHTVYHRFTAEDYRELGFAAPD